MVENPYVIVCLIPCIQEAVYLYMLIIVTCLILSICRGNLAFKLLLNLKYTKTLTTPNPQKSSKGHFFGKIQHC